jgi:hypothetical protein
MLLPRWKFRYFSQMKAASVNEIKQELKEKSKEDLIGLCLRLARFKKENKELLDYLLFNAHDEDQYIKEVKEEIDEGFAALNTSSTFLAKKTLRKMLRISNKYVRYTGSKTVEAEILMHYLTRFIAMRLPWKKTKVLRNMYDAQVKKVKQAIDTMHEDMQYDYLRALKKIETEAS